MLRLQHAPPTHTHRHCRLLLSFSSQSAAALLLQDLCPHCRCVVSLELNGTPPPPCLSLKPPSRTLLPLPEGPRQRFPCSREEKRDPGMGSLPASTRRGRSCPTAASHPLTFIIKETPHPPPLSSPLTTPVERSYSASRRRSHC